MASSDNLEITVDRDECTGCGVCANEAPETFELDDDDVAVVKDKPWDDVDAVVAAAEGCPTESITVVDKAAGKKLYPED